jgi:uncharacterized damage-inducible protein DinB
MSLSSLLLPEFDAECASARTVLQRIPDDRIEWKPHAKSFAMGHLAQLVAMLPGWTDVVIGKTEHDIAPKDGPSTIYSFQKVSALLELFDQNVQKARPMLAACSDADFEVPWTLKAAGNAVATASRYMMFRTNVLNHLVHHRAQLGVYLRLTDQPVPQMYGPTADEGKPKK